MCSIEDCEMTNWVFGAKGSCNNVTDRCDCPSGFTGYEPYIKINDCHLNVAGFRTLSIASFMCNVLAVPFVIYVILMIKQRMRTISESSMSSDVQAFAGTSSENSRGSTNMGSQESEKGNHHTTKVASARQSRLMLQAELGLKSSYYFLSWLVFSLPIGGFFATTEVEDVDKVDMNTPGNVIIAMGFAWVGFWLGCWNVLYTYWKTIPDWRWLSIVLQLKSPFVRHPKLFETIARSLLVSHILVMICSHMVVGLLLDTSTSSFYNFKLIMIATLYCTVTLGLLFVPSCAFLSRIFMKALESPTIQANGPVAQLNQAVELLWNGRVLMVIIVIYSSILFTWQCTETGLRFIWILQPLSMIMACGTIVWAVHIVGRGSLVGATTS